eukprot:gene26076-34093_t
MTCISSCILGKLREILSIGSSSSKLRPAVVGSPAKNINIFASHFHRMSVVLFTILLTLISCSFSSAIYDPNKEVKMMTEDNWPSHGPWIVTIEYGANELFIEKAQTKHLTLQREAKIRNEEEIVHSFAVKKSFSDLTGVNAVVLEGLSKNDLKSMSEVIGVYPDLPVYPTAYSWGTDRIDQSALPLSGSGSTYNSYFRGCG